MTRTRLAYLFIILLYGCGSQTQAVPPTFTVPSPTATIQPPTEIPTSIPFTPTAPEPTADATIFGTIGQSEIQAFSLEPVANAIFSKTMQGLVAGGRIQEYLLTHTSVFPGGDGTLLAEIIFNVRTTDASWLTDGGTQADDNWINDKCYRFDFITTETEFQLKNRRLCG